MRRGEYEGARDWFTRALDTSYGRHPYLQTNLAIVNRQLGDHELAAWHYEESLRLSPNDPVVNYYYGVWREVQGDPEGAYKHAKRALAVSADYSAAIRLRDRVALAVLPLDEAQALALQRSDPNELIELSLRMYQADRFEDCIHLCRVVLEIDSMSVPAWNNICAASNQLRRWGDAISACENALRINPEHQLAQNNLAWARQQAEAQRR